MKAKVIYTHPTNGSELIEVGEHQIQFGGGSGDGYCYNCQSFECLDNLTFAEKIAINSAPYN